MYAIIVEFPDFTAIDSTYADHKNAYEIASGMECDVILAGKQWPKFRVEKINSEKEWYEKLKSHLTSP